MTTDAHTPPQMWNYPPPPPPQKKRSKTKIILGSVAAIFVVWFMIGFIGGGNDKPTDQKAPSAATVSTAVAAPSAVPVEAPPANNFTAGQENAIEKAESYLDYSAFSRQGLIEQLEFEGFSTADATFAVDHVTVDWNEQAVKKTESYLDYSSFSKSGLIDQLEFEGFTPAQAQYGADTAYGS